MNKRILAGLALAGSVAIAAPLLVHAAGGAADGPRAEAGAERGWHGKRHGEHGRGMHGHHKHGHHQHGMQGMHGQGRHADGGMGMGRAMMADLGLTDEQRQKIAELRQAQRPVMREQARAMHEANRELRRLGFSGEYDESKARALGERAAQASTGLALLRAKAANDFYQVLTPEQRQKFSERMARYEERRQQRRGPDGEGRRGKGEGPARGPASAAQGNNA
jgi:protein CpxP